MTVHCPHCSTGYLLPDHLMGPRGARVRCPNCKRPFVVLRETVGAATAAQDMPPMGPAVYSEPAVSVTDPTPPSGADPVACAEDLLDALAARLGSGLGAARARGRVLAEFGPEVMKAFDDYRAQLGERASVAAFRQVLKARWGVDLVSEHLPRE